MRYFTIPFFILAILQAFSSQLLAKDSPTNPIISPEGKIFPLPNAAFQPDKSKSEYKIIFTLTQASDSPDKINPSLEHVAKIINLYASAGIPPSHLKIVAVASGDATPLALKSSYYKQKFGVENPNEALISKLKAVGVQVIVCGQAWHEHHFDTQSLNPNVKMALSALITSVLFQEKGYALIPM
ncbi:DsrE family protein [Helicobacter sp. 11S02596-1]|uniref:DsrE family protein n=1 Tax=Helicobacter sp. 11S02596-1 TaxID=1476194 RepID=UPI000BA73155|nr:DsrE family protein [Helicobacter sp. 11S02596-1]PAF44265.1 hypothetical protein BJI48_03550 [Helicobacter sp. 11S02596-1]